MPRRVLLAVVAVGVLAFACDDLRTSAGSPPDGGTSATSSSSGASGTSGTSSTSGDPPVDGADAGDAGSPFDDCPTGVCILAANRLSPADLTVRGGYAYWVEQGTATNSGKDARLSRAPTEVCTADAGCVRDILDAGPNVSGLAVNKTDVYLTYTSLGATGRVTRVPITGGAPTVLANAETGARRIALTDKSAFWVNAGNGQGTGQIRQGDLDDAFVLPPGTVADKLDTPIGLAVSRNATDADGVVFFTAIGQADNSGTVQRVDFTGNNLRTIAKSQSEPRGIALDSTFVYWVNRTNGTVHRARWDGSDALELITSARSPVAVAVDTDGVYWTERGTDPDLLDGRIRSADLDGTNAKTLADVPAPIAIAVDGPYVYAATRGTLDNGYRDGSILKMRKR